jgi:hypothetical protein
VTRDGFQKHRPDWPGGCLQFCRVHQRNGPVLFASTLSGVGEGERWGCQGLAEVCSMRSRVR